MSTRIKILVVLGAVVMLAAIAWLATESATVRGWVGAASTGASGEVLPAQPEGVRKCRTRKGVEYVTGACPAGSTEVTIDQGAVTVVEAQRPSVIDSVTPSGKPLDVPNARDLLLGEQPPPGPSLHEKQIDAIVNQTH